MNIHKVNKLAFTDQEINVGLDVHKKQWKVTIMVNDVVMKTFSQDPSPRQLHNYLQRSYPGGEIKIGYEAGFSGFWTQRALSALGLKTWVLHPADIPTTQQEKLQKEDKRDSKKIARAQRNKQVGPNYVPSIETEHDRFLMRRREQIVRKSTRIKNQIKSTLMYTGIVVPSHFPEKSGWSNDFVKWLATLDVSPTWNITFQTMIRELHYLKAELLQVNQTIRELSKSPRYNEAVSCLVSIPGIGPISAMILLTEVEYIGC